MRVVDHDNDNRPQKSLKALIQLIWRYSINLSSILDAIFSTNPRGGQSSYAVGKADDLSLRINSHSRIPDQGT